MSAAAEPTSQLNFQKHQLIKIYQEVVMVSGNHGSARFFHKQIVRLKFQNLLTCMYI